MLLFALSVAEAAVGAEVLGAALTEAAKPFLHLDPATLQTFTAPSGTVTAATLGHSPELVAPRRHVAATDDVVCFYDGLPVDPEGRHAPHDAAVLLERWEELAGTLEGQFSAVRADLGEGRVEILTDTLGLSPVFAARPPGGGWLVANNVAVVRTVTGLDRPDTRAVNTFVTMGWAGGDRTMLDQVRIIPGGHRVVLDPRGRRDRPHFSPGQAINQARTTSLSPGEFVEGMVTLTRAATTIGLPVRSALTAGRDTRAMLGLLRALGAEVRYETIGTEAMTDVIVARDIAGKLGLHHVVRPPSRVDGGERWREVVDAFLATTDGLAGLPQLLDVGNLAERPDHVGIEFWGAGGEAARADTHAIKGLATNVPVLSRSRALQQRFLRLKVHGQDLVTPAALQDAGAHVDMVVGTRLDEGWKPYEQSEAFYIFERMARWGGSGIRRASPVDDLFAPFCSQLYLRYAFSLTPGERFIEAAHWRLLTALDREARDIPFEYPWPVQRPALAPAMAATAAAKDAAERLAARLGRGPSEPEWGDERYMTRWLIDHREDLREQCLSHDGSFLWDHIDRAGLERVLDGRTLGGQAEDALLRAITVIWYFHGH